MARQQTSMDGFMPRQPGPNRRVGGVIGGENANVQPLRQPVNATPETVASVCVPRAGQISRSEIDASLRGIDDEESLGPPRQRNKTPKPPSSQRRKWIKRTIVAILIVIVALGAYTGIKALIASSKVFQGSIFDVFQNAPLKQDANGRSNILILGTSQDDPGHQGANLTDSMMILSIDQTNKNAYMISIPRDLWVKYGKSCDSGNMGKINVYYSCVGGGSDDVQTDQSALTQTANFVGNIFGLDVQYGANVDYTVMRDLVNAVGGSITVNIQGDGVTPAGIKPGSVMDSNFDWKCGVGDRKVSRAQVLQRCPPRGHFIDYGPGPQNLDAEHALYLAQARGDSAPTWGLAQSNFDREKNQQKILVAIRDKAMSTGMLADFGKVSSILDSLGNNLRTTFQTKEIRTLASLAKDIPSDQIQSISLIDGDKPVMDTGMVDGQSVVEPSAGTYDYSDLQEYLQQKLSSDPVVREAAPIAVYNGSGVAGMAQTEADKLTADKYNVQSVANAPEGDYPHYTLYQIGSGDDATAKKLEQRFGVTVKTGTPPVTVDSGIKFVLIVGPDTSGSSANSTD